MYNLCGSEPEILAADTTMCMPYVCVFWSKNPNSSLLQHQPSQHHSSFESLFMCLSILGASIWWISWNRGDCTAQISSCVDLTLDCCLCVLICSLRVLSSFWHQRCCPDISPFTCMIAGGVTLELPMHVCGSRYTCACFCIVCRQAFDARKGVGDVIDQMNTAVGCGTGSSLSPALS